MLQPYIADLVGEGRSFEDVRSFIEGASRSSEPVIILGESGTGKEAAARSSHFGSRRKSHPFISIDAGLYYDRELERELFGCTGGGVTRKGLLEFASLGTCYISNVEQLSPHLQGRLEYFIQTGTVLRVGSNKPVSSKARLITSSTKDVSGFTEGGLFSPDLFQSLSGQLLAIQPLRHRSEDVAPFVTRVAQSFSVETGRDPKSITFATDALEALVAYPWPGNYDELKAELLRVFQSGVVTVTKESLAPEILHFSLGAERESEVRAVIEEIEDMIQEFRIMVRLDAEYGDILIDKADWDVKLKCYDRAV